MKLTTKIIIGLLLLFACSVFFSAFKFKLEYEKNDKRELYFLYGTISEQPYSHLVVRGGNLSTIIYEPAERSSVRVLKSWTGYNNKAVKTAIRNDTLYLDFPSQYKDIYEKNQLKNTAMVRIFSPELKSVTGFNTNVKLTKFKQNELTADISGNSSLIVESLIYDFASISVKATDTTDIIFEMSPTLRKSQTSSPVSDPHEIPAVVKGWDAFHIKKFHGEAIGQSFINIGHAQVDSVDFTLSDTAAILLTGGTIRKNQLGKK